MPKLTPESVKGLTASLDAVYKECVAKVNSRSYTIFSGEPEATLGALRIMHDTETPSLERTAARVIADGDDEMTVADETQTQEDRQANGVRAVKIWRSELLLKNAVETEKRMRETAQDTIDTSSVQAGVKYVAEKTGEDIGGALEGVAEGIFSGVFSLAKGILSKSPVLLAGVIGVLLLGVFIVYRKIGRLLA